jgi:hypothetical protein
MMEKNMWTLCWGEIMEEHMKHFVGIHSRIWLGRSSLEKNSARRVFLEYKVWLG